MIDTHNDIVDLGGNRTELLEIRKQDGELATIDDWIELLTKAKKTFGNIGVMMEDQNSEHRSAGGVYTAYLNHGYDFRKQYGKEYKEDNTLVIYG